MSILRENTEKGFTLLEVIFAISILTVGILAVASMQISSIRGNAFAQDTSEASTWAMDRVEKLMDLPYNHSDLDNGNHTDPNNPYNNRYNISWDVVSDVIINGTKTVTVTVTWSDHGVTKNVVMTFTLGEVV